VVSFFAGVGYSIFKYKKQIQSIYKRYKDKKMEDKIRYRRFNGIRDETISSSSSNSNENDLISEDSYNSASEKEGSHKEGIHNNNESDEDDESSDYDNRSDVALSERLSERITSFGSLTEIVSQHVLNESITVFNDVSEFELSCRFLWNNEANEAFMLMKDLYKESLDQFNKNPYIYTYYSYYLIYSNERKAIIEENDDEKDYKKKYGKDYEEQENISSDGGESEEDIDNDKNKHNNEQNNNNEINNVIDENDIKVLLENTSSSNLNIWEKYFVKYLTFEIKEKKKDDKDHYKKEAMEKLMKLQIRAIDNHLNLLNLYKKYFNFLILNQYNNQTRNTEFNLDKFFEGVFNLKIETSKIYNEILEKYPNEKGSINFILYF